MAGKIVKCAARCPDAILSFICDFLCFTVFITIVLLFLPFYLIYLAYQYLTLLVIYCIYPAGVVAVKGCDEVWLNYGKGRHGVINALLCFSGELDAKQWQERIFKGAVEARLRNNSYKFPKMKKYAGRLLTQAMWIPEEQFKIEEHAYLYQEEVITTKSELERVVSNITNEEMPEKKSPWFFLFLKLGGEFGEACAFLLRIHHSVGDGISIVRLLFQDLADVPIEFNVPVQKNVGLLRYGTKVFRQAWMLFHGPRVVLHDFRSKVESYFLTKKETLGGRVEVAYSDPIDMSLLKKIRKNSQSTITAVFSTAITGALHNYIQDHPELKEMPKHVLVTSTVFLRAPIGQTKMTNDVGAVFLELPFGQDNRTRLYETRIATEKLKSTPAAPFYRFLIRYFGNTLPSFMTTNHSDRLSQKLSFSISNVPGPTGAIELCGKEMGCTAFWPLVTNMGVAFSLLTYRNIARIGVICDTNAVSSAHDISERIQQVINELAQEFDDDDNAAAPHEINVDIAAPGNPDQVEVLIPQEEETEHD